MHVPRRQAFEVLSISALDIFASALGAFILMAILMFPYYLKQPALEAEQAGALAELAAARSDKNDLADALASGNAEAEAAQATLAAARRRLQRASAAARALPDAPAAGELAPRSGEQATPLAIDDLDLLVVIDTTKSMKTELADLQANLIGVVNVLHRLAASLRIGIVAFKDRGDAYLTRAFPLRAMDKAQLRSITEFLQRIEAVGGGDRPEPVDEALKVALDMAWRDDAQGRIIVIGDAVARQWQRALDLAAAFRRSAPSKERPRIVSTIFTGGDPGAKLFFEQLASSGGGDASTHQGRMIESILLSILPPRR